MLRSPSFLPYPGMSFDNLCKLLSEKHPERFARWILGEPQTAVEVLKTELSIEPIRADQVTFLKLQGRILHLEFQTQWESKPPIRVMCIPIIGRLLFLLVLGNPWAFLWRNKDNY